MTHTPGPWRWRSVRVNGGQLHCFLESARPPEECSCRDVTVFALREDWTGTFADTTQAKHRRQFDRDLIAAAPDLLAAANLARICLKNRDQSEREAAAYAVICAAIAKAEGSFTRC
jgi:hypothetical protein